MCICLCTAGKTASASLRRRESRNWVYRLLQALQNVLCAKQAGKDGEERMKMDMGKSSELFEEAKKRMVGGGCAGGRIHRVLERPLYVECACGSHIFTADGVEYIDYHCGAGAIMFGFDHPRIREAVLKCVENGFYMNFDSEYTVEFAKLFTQLVPTVEKM